MYVNLHNIFWHMFLTYIFTTYVLSFINIPNKMKIFVKKWPFVKQKRYLTQASWLRKCLAKDKFLIEQISWARIRSQVGKAQHRSREVLLCSPFVCFFKYENKIYLFISLTKHLHTIKLFRDYRGNYMNYNNKPTRKEVEEFLVRKEVGVGHKREMIYMI